LLYVEDNPANMKLIESLIARRSDLQLVTAVNELSASISPGTRSARHPDG